MNIVEKSPSNIVVQELKPVEDANISGSNGDGKNSKAKSSNVTDSEVLALRKRAMAYIISNPKSASLINDVPKEFADISRMSKEDLLLLVERLNFSANKTIDSSFSKTLLSLTGSTISKILKDEEHIIATRLTKNEALVDTTQQIISQWLFNFSVYAKWIMLMSGEVSIGFSEIAIKRLAKEKIDEKIPIPNIQDERHDNITGTPSTIADNFIRSE